jgi:hypothetical protein
MASPEGEALAQELLKQLKQHPRISVLLIPSPKIIDDEEHISFYWLNHDQGEAATTKVRVKDYADQPPQAAASESSATCPCPASTTCRALYATATAQNGPPSVGMACGETLAAAAGRYARFARAVARRGTAVLPRDASPFAVVDGRARRCGPMGVGQRAPRDGRRAITSLLGVPSAHFWPPATSRSIDATAEESDI